MSHSLSLVIPCYNEEAAIRAAALRLVQGFKALGVDLELILVDNGSTDRTGAIIDGLIAEGLPVAKATVPVNQGFGNGVLTGLRQAGGEWVGFLCADEQVAADDVVRLFELAASSAEPRLFKVRRRFRMDGAARKGVSLLYNAIATVLFGWLGSFDLNANPKILRKEELDRMSLQSTDWFLDLEVMIKAKRLRLPVHELNVVSQMRIGGSSNVRPATCWEFAVNLIKHRIRSFDGPRAAD